VARVTDGGADEATRGSGVLRALGWVIAILAIYRVLYHLTYVGEVPFAVAPISDGRVYESAAKDILLHPPLGTAPFHLQGAYAVMLAVGMALGGIGTGLLLQLLFAVLGFWALFVACRRMFGAKAAGITVVLALAVPVLAFYENKFLTATITVVAECLVLLAYAKAEGGDPRRGWFARLGCGVASGLAVLARPNLLLALPTTAWALVRVAPGGVRRVAVLGAWLLGLGLALAPMAVRNEIVTGTPTVMPAHGGGTSFYIGNNAKARGVWNSADGLLTGDVSHEVDELGAGGKGTAAELAAREQALGRELYARAFAEIADDPGHWAWLEVRKLWLLVGNDELTQDYDWIGEREMLPWAWRWGVPFGVVLGLAVLGVGVVRRGEHGAARLGLLGGLAGATVIANLVFFTSAQHRLPLLIPLLVLAGPGVLRIGEALRTRGRSLTRRDKILAAVAALLMMQAVVPRTRVHEPSAAHYYNLALAWDRVYEPRRALDALDRALMLRPDHPVILIERAVLRRELGYFDAARQDLDHLAVMPDVPQWVQRRAAREAIWYTDPIAAEPAP